MLKKIHLLTALLAGTSFLYGVWNFFKVSDFAATAVKAKAEIVKVDKTEKQRREDDGTIQYVSEYSISVMYFDKEDGTHHKTFTKSKNTIGKVGNSVTVLYNPENPSDVLLEKDVKTNRKAWIFMAAGVVLFLFSFMQYRDYRKKNAVS